MSQALELVMLPRGSDPTHMPMVVRTCCDLGLPAMLYTVHKLVTKSLARRQPGVTSDASKASDRVRAPAAAGGGGSGGSMARALHYCLANACACFFKMLLPAPLTWVLQKLCDSDVLIITAHVTCTVGTASRSTGSALLPASGFASYACAGLSRSAPKPTAPQLSH
jgi:hypothetical protein